MSWKYQKHKFSLSNPLKALDFSMIEESSDHSKDQSNNSQDSLYQKLLTNTAKVSNKPIKKISKADVSFFYVFLLH